MPQQCSFLFWRRSRCSLHSSIVSYPIQRLLATPPPRDNISNSGTLYSKYVLMREERPDPIASMAFWKDRKHSTSKAFTDFFVDKVRDSGQG